ncbi:MAG: Rv3654c family TadE-like protein [Nocardioidaceae bacterium]
MTYSRFPHAGGDVIPSSHGSLNSQAHHSSQCCHGGYASVWAVAWIGCLLAVTGAALLVAGVVARQHHVDGSADLVALSAAGALHDGSNACEMASRVAATDLVSLGKCRLAHGDVIVEVTDRVDLPLGLHLDLVGRARAGPVSE